MPRIPIAGLVFVAGPTGSGKTSLVRRFAKSAAVYVEQSELNPHLAVRSGGRFDVKASQNWFLDQIDTFLKRHQHEAIIVDQHPFVVSGAYGRLFYERGWLTGQEFRRLNEHATEIWRRAIRRYRKVLTVCLTARTGTLKARIMRRRGSRLTAREIEAINRLYSSIVFPGPCLVLNTEVAGLDYEQQLIAQWFGEKVK
jgi:ribose 1,5-bisphosphokinase PhnN